LLPLVVVRERVLVEMLVEVLVSDGVSLSSGGRILKLVVGGRHGGVRRVRVFVGVVLVVLVMLVMLLSSLLMPVIPVNLTSLPIPHNIISPETYRSYRVGKLPHAGQREQRHLLYLGLEETSEALRESA
jgi:hypothetical protein